MTRLICLCSVSLFVTITLVGAANVGDELARQICSNKKHPSQSLTSVIELRELADQVGRGLVECGDWESAIEDLNDLIQEHDKDVCSQASADDIADYHRRHLAVKDNSTNTLVEFPMALKKFFIAYGLKVSSFCRKQMADLLLGQGQKLASESDFKEVDELAGSKKMIEFFVGDPSEKKGHDNLAFNGDFIKFMALFDSSNITSEHKLMLQLSTTKKVHRIQALCERRFKPIYKDLILPLVTLAEVGFNYKRDHGRRETSEVQQVYLWYRIVFLCEAIGKVEFFQTAEEKAKAAGSDRLQVQVLKKEEADELRGQQTALMNTVGDDLHQIEYNPQLQSMPLDGIIYNGKDRILEDAILKFRRRTRNEIDPDMVHKLKNFIKDKAVRGSFKVMSKLSGIKSLTGDGKMSGVDMVLAMDEYAHALETGNSKAISYVWPGSGYTTRKKWELFFTILIIALIPIALGLGIMYLVSHFG